MGCILPKPCQRTEKALVIVQGLDKISLSPKANKKKLFLDGLQYEKAQMSKRNLILLSVDWMADYTFDFLIF